MKLPNLNYEIELWKNGYTVIGIDEVGRGAFAGPLYVGGVIFNPLRLRSGQAKSRIKYLESLGINDSKKLSPRRRKVLAEIIQKECLAFHTSSIDVSLINRFGIGKTTFIAMRDVVKNLRETLRLHSGQESNQKIFVLVDGFYIKHLKTVGLKNQKGIVHGDGISLSIAAASIIAKVARDDHMIKLSAKHPQYRFDKNKGYGTLFHQTAIQNFGATRLHRTQFIRNFV